MPGSAAQGSPTVEHQGTIGTCQICGSAIPSRYTIPAKSRWGCDSDFHIYWCKQCDAGFLLPRPTSELLESFYSNKYFADYGKGAKVQQTFLDRLRVRLAWQFDRSEVIGPKMIEAITNSHSAKVCDLGCGNGVLLAELKERGFQVVGIEPSPFARKTVEEKGITVYAGTAEALPDSIPQAPFDVVVMCHVLEHCLDLKSTIQHALQLVRPGGHLIIEVPNCQSFQFEKRGPAWFHFDVGRHVNYFTENALKTLVEQQTAKVVRFYHRQYVDHFMPGTIVTESAFWDRSHAEEASANLAGIRRPARLENWMSLLGSVAMKPDRKYRCVGMIARKA